MAVNYTPQCMYYTPAADARTLTLCQFICKHFNTEHNNAITMTYDLYHVTFCLYCINEAFERLHWE
jgi:hypothetical protein